MNTMPRPPFRRRRAQLRIQATRAVAADIGDALLCEERFVDELHALVMRYLRNG